MGYVYDQRNIEVDVGSPLLTESSPTDAGIVASAEYDSRDTAFAPTRGFAAALEYLSSEDSLGGDRDWQRAELGLGVAVPFRRNIWWITMAGGSDLTGDLPADGRSRWAARKASRASSSARCASAATGRSAPVISGTSRTS